MCGWRPSLLSLPIAASVASLFIISFGELIGSEMNYLSDNPTATVGTPVRCFILKPSRTIFAFHLGPRDTEGVSLDGEYETAEGITRLSRKNTFVGVGAISATVTISSWPVNVTEDEAAPQTCFLQRKKSSLLL